MTGPVIAVELAAAVWLVADRPDYVPPLAAWVLLALVGVLVLGTAVQFVPMHRRLCAGREEAVLEALVRRNWCARRFGACVPWC